MKAVKLLIAIFIITSLTNSTTCFSNSKSAAKIFDRTAWIPADFNPENIVLLIDNVQVPNPSKAEIKMYEKESKNTKKWRFAFEQ